MKVIGHLERQRRQFVCVCVCVRGVDSLGTLGEEQRAGHVTQSEASSFFCAPHGHEHLRHGGWTGLRAAGGQCRASLLFLCMCGLNRPKERPFIGLFWSWLCLDRRAAPLITITYCAGLFSTAELFVVLCCTRKYPAPVKNTRREGSLH